MRIKAFSGAIINEDGTGTITLIFDGKLIK